MELIQADWQVPGKVRAITTTRSGGNSKTPFDSLNLGDHVDDDPGAVAENRQQLINELKLTQQPQWLQQVHGTVVVKADDQGSVPVADACWSDQPGQACIVMTADCLPVFFSDGNRVAVAHAGWRGLADGVLEKTLDVFPQAAAVHCWLGPAIGPKAFEVGGEVREQFCQQQADAEQAFVPSTAEGKWLADIYQLARLRLQRAGVQHISGGDHCTFTDEQRFFSYRRDGQTGRMASVIWLES